MKTTAKRAILPLLIALGLFSLTTCTFAADGFGKKSWPSFPGIKIPPINIVAPPVTQPPTCPPVRPPVHPPVHPPVCPPVHPPVHPPVYPPVTCPKPIPVPTPQPIVQPSPTIQWRFGFNLSLTSTPYGQGLYVQSVDPFGPAARSGVQAGDILLTANGLDFRQAANNHHGVRLLQYAVNVNPGGGVPTAVASYPVTPSPTVQLVVLRQGHTYAIAVMPNRVGAAPGGNITPRFPRSKTADNTAPRYASSLVLSGNKDLPGESQREYGGRRTLGVL